MPEDLGSQIEFQPRSAVLTFEEISRIVAGVRAARRAQGAADRWRADRAARPRGSRRDDPRAVAGIEHVAMTTTNGHLLEDLAQPLAAAGLDSVNVSLDTLDADKVRTSSPVAAISRACSPGSTPRSPPGLVADKNDERGRARRRERHRDRRAWFATRGRGRCHAAIHRARMPMSRRAALRSRHADLGAHGRATLEEAFGPLREHIAGESRRAGPARYWSVPPKASASRRSRKRGRAGSTRSASSRRWPSTSATRAPRLRLAATGDLHACLGHDDAISLRDVMRNDGGDDDLVRAISGAVTGKRAGHVFETNAPTKHMIGIGG